MVTITDPLKLRAGLRRRVDRTRDFVTNTPVDAVGTVVVGTLALLGAFVGFLVMSQYTAVAVVAFLASAGYGWIRHQELTARWVTLSMTLASSIVLILITAFIVMEAWPTLEYESVELLGISVPGLGVFLQPEWNPRSNPNQFSMLPMIQGTVLITVIATLVAGPLGVSAALFLSEIAPPTVREFVKPAVEILAGIPSIVYGFLGFAVLGPWVSDQFGIVGQGTYLFVGIVVGLMALPTVVSVAEDAIDSVPESMKSGSLAIGTTDWQTMTSITVPAAFSGVSAAVLLGVGRAIGETMAATVMLRNEPKIVKPLYNVFYGQESLTSLIANKYGSAVGLQESALFVSGLILFITVLCLSIGSQLIESHMHKKLGGAD